MSYVGPDTGATTIHGLPPATWALTEFLPPLLPSILGQAVAIFVCIWEFVVLFPSEVAIWKRLLERGKPFRWQFAPLMTLLMRHTMLFYAGAAIFVQYSTNMTDSQCAASSGIFVVAVICLNTSSLLSMAWRSHAVAVGVIERPSMRTLVRCLLAIVTGAAIVMVWITMIWAQFTGSWTPRASHGICVSDFSFVPNAKEVWDDPLFWYYVVSIMFDASCMITICLSLKKLARRSTGFSKLIKQLFYHSLGYFLIIFLLFLLGIIWLRVQNAYWAANFIQIIQGSIVIRILISEQKKAQRPHDTDFFDAYAIDDETRAERYRYGEGTTYEDRFASDSRFAPREGGSATATSRTGGHTDARSRSRRRSAAGVAANPTWTEEDEEEGVDGDQSYEMKGSVKDDSFHGHELARESLPVETQRHDVTGAVDDADLESGRRRTAPRTAADAYAQRHNPIAATAEAVGTLQRTESDQQSPPSDIGGAGPPSEMQASSKTAHSERSVGTSDRDSDGKAEKGPVVTVHPLQ